MSILYLQNTPMLISFVTLCSKIPARCVPSDTSNHSLIVSICPVTYLFWLLAILTAHQHTLFGGKEISGTENIGLIKSPWSFGTHLPLWPWTLNPKFTQNTPPAYDSLKYHPIRYGYKKISSSAGIAETVIIDYMSPHSDLDLEDNQSFHMTDTLTHDDASPYQVWLQKV